MPTEQQLQEIGQAVRDWRHWVGNYMLDALGAPDLDPGRNLFERRLELIDDEQVAELLDFFDLDRERTRIWEPGFRLFISHVAESVPDLLPLTESLSRYGISSFLAHRDINPGLRWHQELTTALGTMDALLSFHARGFAASVWCGQEVGFALGRNVVVVPVTAGEIPSGFVAEIQAFGWNPADAQAGATRVVQHLKGDDRSAIALGNGIAHKLKFAGSYNTSDFLVGQLRACGRLSETARHDVRLALKFNDQVGGRGNESLLDLPVAE
jgi:hypothetical protein